jgi:hypothetical protein
MGTMGSPNISRCTSLCYRRKGAISLVASFVVHSPIRNLLLHRAQCLKHPDANRLVKLMVSDYQKASFRSKFNQLRAG